MERIGRSLATASIFLLGAPMPVVPAGAGALYAGAANNYASTPSATR